MPKFVCRYCARHTASRVVKSTPTRRGVRRLRVCLRCLGTFATLEAVAPMRAAPMHRPRQVLPP